MCRMMIDFDTARTETMAPVVNITPQAKPVHIDLHQFDCVIVNTSGGKDSQTALRQIVLMAREQGYPTNQIHAVHSDLGKCEWPDVPEYARQQVAEYGLSFEIVKQQNKAGENQTILDRVLERKQWPDAARRWCTSDFKRTPCSRKITKEDRAVKKAKPEQKRRRILNVMGMRAEESPARANLEPISYDHRSSSKTRKVYQFLPIHHWSTADVWADIRSSGVTHHWAYDLGMPRLSCVFCVLGSRSSLMIGGEHNPELLAEYVAVEQEVNHDFQHGKPIRLISEALARGERATVVENWVG